VKKEKNVGSKDLSGEEIILRAYSILYHVPDGSRVVPSSPALLSPIAGSSLPSVGTSCFRLPPDPSSGDFFEASGVKALCRSSNETVADPLRWAAVARRLDSNLPCRSPAAPRLQDSDFESPKMEPVYDNFGPDSAIQVVQITQM
jgi:hypothetical protein